MFDQLYDKVYSASTSTQKVPRALSRARTLVRRCLSATASSAPCCPLSRVSLAGPLWGWWALGRGGFAKMLSTPPGANLSSHPCPFRGRKSMSRTLRRRLRSCSGTETRRASNTHPLLPPRARFARSAVGQQDSASPSSKLQTLHTSPMVTPCLKPQIKTWAASSEVKDKQPLLDARKTIEQVVRSLLFV